MRLALSSKLRAKERAILDFTHKDFEVAWSFRCKREAGVYLAAKDSYSRPAVSDEREVFGMARLL
jgi:hypothetical protein